MLINTLGGLEGLPSLLIYKYEYTSANYHKTSPGQCEAHCAHRMPSDIEHCRTPWQADGAGPDIRGIAENYRSRNTFGGLQHSGGRWSMLCFCAQCQGLWAQWTGDGRGCAGCPPIVVLLLWVCVVVVGGSQPEHSTYSVLRASVQHEGFSRGGHVPHGCSSERHTFMPLCWHWVVGQCLRHATVACIRQMLGPLGPLVMWWWVLPVSSSTLGVALLCHGCSWVMVCTGCGVCVSITRLCVTPWLWLCRCGGGRGGVSPLWPVWWLRACATVPSGGSSESEWALGGARLPMCIAWAVWAVWAPCLLLGGQPRWWWWWLLWQRLWRLHVLCIIHAAIEYRLAQPWGLCRRAKLKNM